MEITHSYRKLCDCPAASCLVSTKVHSANERSPSVTAWWGLHCVNSGHDVHYKVFSCICTHTCWCPSLWQRAYTPEHVVFTPEASADAWRLCGGCERGGTQPASSLPLHRPPAVHQIQTGNQRVSAARESTVACGNCGLHFKRQQFTTLCVFFQEAGPVQILLVSASCWSQTSLGCRPRTFTRR